MNAVDFISMYGLTFARLSGFFVSVPLFSTRQLPVMHRVGFSAFLAYYAMFTLTEPIEMTNAFVLQVVYEVMIGLLLGLLINILFFAPQIAGGVIDLQLGLAMASAYDPMFGGQSPLIGRFYYIFTLFILLTSNLHLLLIDGIYYSFQIYPPGQPMINFSEASLMMAVKVVTMTMMVALQLALPMMASLLLVDLALGFLAKSAPQFNIFAIGFSFKLIAGFAVMVLLMGLTLTGISQFIPLLQEVMHDFMLILGDAS
ncbi:MULTISPECIES: flagellar biosynthetic protein FliR [unclassified Exiguobacterium]|jgi:flagellar biosynthetic protein FliR|uniref:flagellar biosynthetic protein FliR n=1 Tax=unclassified Exiguobacterium TaxID=2644629 RepID=UPI001BE57BDE|nr:MULTISPECIES: flagellar biosynthetic protein FliR [unclassified Exiguobacterium]MDE0562088.1 flagellar biosynthetic protein FliR [Exiguobacterium sp. B2(2022)]